jgi:hypothetical protein
MDSNTDLILLNESNYVVWALDMETQLKSKGPCQYMKVVILGPIDHHTKSIIIGNNDEARGLITTYISWKIEIHLSGIDFPH